MTPQKLNFYKGAILNPQNDENCDFYSQGLLVTCKKGEKAIIQDLLPLKKGELKYKGMMTPENTTDFSDSVIMPGFFDMHFHWVQDEVRQMPKDSLLEWLEKYTFPTEMKFKNKRYPKNKAEEFFKQLTMEG